MSLVRHLLLNHWGRATHICVDKLTTISSDNGLSPGRRQAIIWTVGGILLIGPLGTNFSEILIGIQTFSFKKMYLKIPSAKWRPSCFGLNVYRTFFFILYPFRVNSRTCSVIFYSLIMYLNAPFKPALSFNLALSDSDSSGNWNSDGLCVLSLRSDNWGILSGSLFSNSSLRTIYRRSTQHFGDVVRIYIEWKYNSSCAVHAFI